MSLFGSPPINEASGAASSSLFDDRPTPVAATSQSSLFADQSQDAASSPWGLPTTKKPSWNDLVKTLLPPSDVPDSYIDTYDSLIETDGLSGGVSLTGVRKALEASGLSPEIQAKVLNVVIPEGVDDAKTIGQGIGRGQFSVLLALIGLAQENEDITLDGVDERRQSLPIPSLKLSPSEQPGPNIEQSQGMVNSQTSKNTEDTNTTDSTSVRPQARRNDSLEFPESDPWSSPALHRGHNHPEQNNPTPRANGISDGKTLGPGRDPRARNKHDSRSGSSADHTTSLNQPSRRSHVSHDDSEGWNHYEAPSTDAFSNQPGSALGNEGLGRSGSTSGGPDLSSGATRPANVRGTGSGVEEAVTITLLPDKEGVFMFQHRNYQVSSVRRNSKVVRRFSDFVWLLDCLHKRYPFRQLPLLPPKRVAVNGTHILSDVSFLEKRRRGLARFSNALVRHPVLSQEQLVVMFLTVPTELAVWRKQAAISVQEEFTGKSLPPTLEESLPPNLSDTFDLVRAGVRRSVEIHVNLCSLLDRLIRRNEGLAADYLRLSLALQSLAETSESTYAVDTSEVPLLNAGLQASARHLSLSQSLLEDESQAWDGGVLEDLKRQRDALVSVRDMFDRRDRLAKNNIPALERRIETNTTKLANLRSRPEGTVKPGEIEKVEEAIVKDKQSIVAQHARGVFIKECLQDELHFFRTSQYHISRLHQDWSQERVKFAELQSDNWKALSEELEAMPLGE
ncbi:MAG: Sorting nexin mvp1 [Peltula sp. TS41687]|nr:MAG: Sorting nexin mvp1 [Peltula sp. TS41687]